MRNDIDAHPIEKLAKGHLLAAKSSNSQTITSNKSSTRGPQHIVLIFFCRKRWPLQSFSHCGQKMSHSFNEVRISIISITYTTATKDKMKLHKGERGAYPSHRFEKALEAFKR